MLDERPAKGWSNYSERSCAPYMEALGREAPKARPATEPVATVAAAGLDRKPSSAWAKKMPTLTTPKNAVTVSIIAIVLMRAPHGEQNGMVGRTVKRNRAALTESRDDR
jgi:hypothetical protein